MPKLEHNGINVDEIIAHGLSDKYVQCGAARSGDVTVPKTTGMSHVQCVIDNLPV